MTDRAISLNRVANTILYINFTLNRENTSWSALHQCPRSTTTIPRPYSNCIIPSIGGYVVSARRHYLDKQAITVQFIFNSHAFHRFWEDIFVLRHVEFL